MNDPMWSILLCTCRHASDDHDGACMKRSGRGRCACPEFHRAESQIHVDTYMTLRSHIQTHGYAPSVRELAATLGVSSTATMNARLGVLESAGLISRVGPRAIRLNGADDE